MAVLRLRADGGIAVEGDLLFDDAVAAAGAGRTLVLAAPGHEVRVSLGGLGHINSVSAVVLLAWVRAAQGVGKQLRIEDVPPQLAGILRVSGVDAVLG